MAATRSPSPVSSTGPGPGGGAAGAPAWRCSVGNSPSVTVTVSSLPSRQITTGTEPPTVLSATILGRARISGTGVPLKRMITSPERIPALAAGPSACAFAISAPRVPAGRRSASAMSSVTLWIFTPIQPRRTRPASRSCATTRLAILDGMEKPSPAETPLGETMAVLMPITWPRMLNSGPPELPELIEASVWIKSS